jgi:lipopolysaccharide/colanic/teichoic acid biosynthesis glycosyltransferase
MSIVGPRPDIPGYYDQLTGEARKVLLLKPGLTSAAAIKYRNEEQLLAAQPNPLSYNDEVLFPQKVKMNLEYLHRRTIWLDLVIIFDTFLAVVPFLKPINKY